MKKIVVIVLVIVMLLAFTACGNSDNTRKIEYAYINLSNGNMVEVEVDYYSIGTRYVSIKAKDGREYITSIVNCLLTTDRLDGYESAR